MPLYAADLGTTGLTDVGLTEYQDDKTAVVARTQVGVTELGATGVYWKEVTLNAATAILYWNSAAEDTSALAVGPASERDLDAVLVDTGTTIPATLGTPAEGTVALDIFEVKSDTESLLTNLSSLDGKVTTVDAVADGIQADLDNATDGLGAIKTAVDGIGGDASAANQTTIINHLTDVKGATWDSGDSLEAIKDALPASGGTGAFAITVTVTDGTNPLENVTVRVQEGVNAFVLTTDASGNATYSLDAATYTVTATKAGYSFTATTRTVTGTEAGTLVDTDLELSAVAVPGAPADATLCTVYGYLETVTNGVAANVDIFLTLSTPAGIKSNKMISGRTVTLKTDASGDVISQDLQRNDLMTPATSVYLVSCEELGLSKAELTLDAATVDLATLIS